MRQTNKYLERKTRLIGLPVDDLMTLLMGGLALLVLGGILGSFAPMPKAYYGLVFLLLIAGYFLLRRMNAKPHPTYLFSMLCFRLLHPRKITVSAQSLTALKPSKPITDHVAPIQQKIRQR